MRALSIAAAGMSAQNTNVEVIANNIANVNTTGFKRSRAEFADLLYQTDRFAGAPGRGRDDTTPEGTQVGLGVRTVAVRSLNLQGAIARTGNALDIGINGRGWFQVAGGNGETLYTRAGSFNRNANGELVTSDGSLVMPTISIPTDATEILISEAGQVSVRTGTDQQLRVIGQLTLAQFVNDTGLEALGGNLFRETPASGAPTVGPPSSRGFGTLNQGYLESSNVDPVKEITELISAQRAYEMNSKVIQAADEMYSTVVRGMR